MLEVSPLQLFSRRLQFWILCATSPLLPSGVPAPPQVGPLPLLASSQRGSVQLREDALRQRLEEREEAPPGRRRSRPVFCGGLELQAIKTDSVQTGLKLVLCFSLTVRVDLTLWGFSELLTVCIYCKLYFSASAWGAASCYRGNCWMSPSPIKPVKPSVWSNWTISH